MNISITADATQVIRSLERYAMATSMDFESAALRLSRGMMRRVVGITPPGQGRRGDGGALTHGDKKRGETSIDSDLAALFIGVKLKGKRPEQHPSPATIHRAAFIASKRPGQRLRNPRGRGSFDYIDDRKLSALAKTLKARVGKLASGWLAGVDALKATGVPAWVRRHGNSRGKATLMVSLSRTSLSRTHGFSFVAANSSVHPSLVPELNRRIDYALGYAANAMNRETNAILAKRGQQFGRI